MSKGKTIEERFMDIAFWLLVAFAIVVALSFVHEIRAQNVVQQGNTFVQSANPSKIKKDNPLLTKYFYQTSDGTKYPIYMSANGKCYIIRTSKNGKQYKQYLPEITAKLKSYETGNKRQ